MAGKAASSANPLVISGTSSETALTVQLHPLVLLTITDYLTRYTIRQLSGPVVGAIIGQQSGRNYTLEHAYQCKTNTPVDANQPLDSEWFRSRLDLYSQVHKDPALDLVAIFATGPADGPQPEHLPLLQQVREISALDNVLLLLFHPDTVDSAQGGKLPISLYEMVDETSSAESDAIQPRFRELTFEVETGDAEMIGVDFVAKGGGLATAVPKSASTGQTTASSGTAKESKGKGKGKAPVAKELEKSTFDAADPSTYLSPEDDELLSLLTAKVNAIRMLNTRINLVRTYLAELPSSYLSDPASQTLPPDSTNFPLLRRFNALVAQAALLMPQPPTAEDLNFQTFSSIPGTASKVPSSIQSASERERQDVHLTTLLANLTRSVAEAQSLGAKLSVVQRERHAKERSQHGRAQGLGQGRLLYSQATQDIIQANAMS